MQQIQPLIDIAIPLFRQYFIPDRAVAVDEAMIAYRGRVAFRQYIRGKLHPWGIKAYVLADSATGYLYSVVIYYGKETKFVRPDLNHSTRAVLSLVQPIVNSGYDIYTDRSYTSPILAIELTKLGTTLTGTVMPNRKDMPLAVKSKNKCRKGDIKSYHRSNTFVVEWTDKRTITTLSTKYLNQVIDVPSR